jgi:hypothetical protein
LSGKVFVILLVFFILQGTIRKGIIYTIGKIGDGLVLLPLLLSDFWLLAPDA